MNFKTIVNGSVLFIGLGLAGYSWFNGYRLRFNVESVSADSPAEDSEVTPEVWQVKEGSIYDGDTLRVVRGSEELKIRFCGIDAPEKKMPMGIEWVNEKRCGKGEDNVSGEFTIT